jgi:hypothetical protein
MSTVIDKLDMFITNNPHSLVTIDADDIIIEKPWGYADCKLQFKANNKQIIKDLNNIIINPRLDAIIHMDSAEVEYIFAFINKADKNNSEWLNRKFDISFNGEKCKCEFKEPTSRLMRIATSYFRIPFDRGTATVQQLAAFRDYQKMEELKEKNKKYFENRVPRSFILKLEGSTREFDIVKLSKQLNFLMLTYDRDSPIIIIREEDKLKIPNTKNIRYINGFFPKELIARNYDSTLLKLIDVAITSDPRDSFLYYYQVFEYAGYYYLDEKTKKDLLRYLKNPSIMSCCDDNLDILVNLFADSNLGDDSKIRKMIEENCDAAELWKEIENDKAFYSIEHVFEGGFTSPKLISEDTTISSWKAMWTPKLIDHLTKIRNCIVHARERRENKVILPTDLNESTLEHYLPLMDRMAREIVIMLS